MAKHHYAELDDNETYILIDPRDETRREMTGAEISDMEDMERELAGYAEDGNMADANDVVEELGED